MTTLALLNGKSYDIKEYTQQITSQIEYCTQYIELTLIKNKWSSDQKEVKKQDL